MLEETQCAMRSSSYGIELFAFSGYGNVVPNSCKTIVLAKRLLEKSVVGGEYIL